MKKKLLTFEEEEKNTEHFLSKLSEFKSKSKQLK